MTSPVVPSTIPAISTPPDPDDEATFEARALPWSQSVATATVAVGTVAGQTYQNALAAQEAALTAVNAPGTSATSTTSLTIGTGAKTLTIQTGKAFAVGQFVVVASTASPTNYMAGQITAHDSGTGSLTVAVTATGGSGTLAAWTVSLASAVVPVREKLTAARTYYVRTNGSDANNGLADTAGGAFLTLQKAEDVASALDNGGYDITIQVADGAYTAGVTLKSFVGSGRIVIRGNTTTPANCVISTTSATCVYGTKVLGVHHVEGFKLQTTTSGFGVVADAGTFVTLGVMNYGAVASGFSHLYASSGGSITQSSVAYTISGGGVAHAQATLGGRIEANVNTVTLSGTPAFAAAYVLASQLGLVRQVSSTFSGTATGARYNVSGNAVVDVAGAGTSYLPGNAAGSTATGGQYL